MEKERLEYFRKKLLKAARGNPEQIKKLKEDSYTLGTDGIQDMADAASNAYNADILMSLSDNERNMVKRDRLGPRQDRERDLRDMRGVRGADQRETA